MGPPGDPPGTNGGQPCGLVADAGPPAWPGQASCESGKPAPSASGSAPLLVTTDATTVASWLSSLPHCGCPQPAVWYRYAQTRQVPGAATPETENGPAGTVASGALPWALAACVPATQLVPQS